MSKVIKISFYTSSLLITTAVIAILLIPAQRSFAVSQNIKPEPKISLTFDDGLASTFTQAAPILAKYGFSGVSYVSTGCLGMTTTPNNCQANNDATYMTWGQVKQLKNSYGWEIGSHTVTHPYLATSDPNDQPSKIPYSQVTQELLQSKADLQAHGITATSFATPYGDYNMVTLAGIAKLYNSQRGFGDTGYNYWPYSEYFLQVKQIQAGVSVKTVRKYINTAIANNSWLILVFHDIKTKPSQDPVDYQYGTKSLQKIARYIKKKKLAVVGIDKALVRSDKNILQNGNFIAGIKDGWHTNNSTYISANSSNQGSFPESTNSIKLTSSMNTNYLFSPVVAVNPDTTYLIKQFLNVKTILRGEVGFYVDEYDANGNWVSGQYKTGEKDVFVENINFPYKPSSNLVKKASLQVIVTANSGIEAYIDNVQWFPLSTIVKPPVINLLNNGGFNQGISNGWTTDDPVNMIADSSSKGSLNNPVNSIKFVASGAGNTHLFSPRIAVNSTNNYTLRGYVDIFQRTSGEVAFYVDEYDSSGNWISGQYKPGIRSLGKREVTYAYTPSSSAVTSASVQVIIVGGSNIQGYVDDIVVYKK